MWVTNCCLQLTHQLQSSEQAVIRAKDMEIAELKRQLEELAQNARPSEGAVMELADELAEMTARKERLAKDLALLNSQILTSELPASGANFAVGATPRKRRARISDVSVHSSASQFLGLGTPRKTIDRRAVSQHSSVLRLEESDAEMDQQEVLMDNLEAKVGEISSTQFLTTANRLWHRHVPPPYDHGEGGRDCPPG